MLSCSRKSFIENNLYVTLDNVELKKLCKKLKILYSQQTGITNAKGIGQLVREIKDIAQPHAALYTTRLRRAVTGVTRMRAADSIKVARTAVRAPTTGTAGSSSYFITADSTKSNCYCTFKIMLGLPL